MTISAVNANRTVPVGEDLTTPEDKLEILRGLDAMFRVDKKTADGEELGLGEWAVLNSDDKLERPGTTPVPNTYLVFSGTDRFDAHATGQVTVLMNSNLVARTTRFDQAPTYNVGDPLTVKDRGNGEAELTKAGSTEPVVARVQSVDGGKLTFESVKN